MAAPSVASHFVELLQQSELLSPQELETAAQRCRLDEGQSAQAAARALVSAGLLTSFQAERLLAGRSRGFFYDRYKVLDVLGCGGMSRIYLAEDLRSGRRVALKVLAEKYEHDAGMLARLKLEAHVGMKLRHRNILRTERVGEAAGAHFLVMEYLPGIELLELIEHRGPVPPAQACDLIRQAAEGLQHAHQAGIVHRDVKPANLLIDGDGRVKILDFGLALLGGEAAEDEFSLAMIFGHECLGTAYYMAPEQSLDSHAVDPRADIYALGCTMYHALAGRVPFPVESSAKAGAVSKVIQAQRTRPPPSIREFVQDVPDRLLAVVERMMAKRPEDRFSSAAQVAEALLPFAERQPVELDLEAILAERVSRARRRVAASQTGRSRSATRVGAQHGSSHAASRSGASRARVETAVGRDTEPDSRAANGEASAESRVLETDRFAAAGVRFPLSSGRLQQPAFLIPTDGGTPIRITTQRVLVGRDPDCDIVLPAGQVSGKHCELRYESGHWRVIDLDSKNGVRVNGRSVKEAALRPGSRLTIARQLHFRVNYHAAGSSRRRLVAVASALGALVLGATFVWYLVRYWLE